MWQHFYDPLDVLVVDMDWHWVEPGKGGWTGYTWNDRLFPSPEKFLQYLKQNNLTWNIYTDSVTALAWLRQRKCKTKLPRTEQNEPLFQMIAKAEAWLRANTYTTRIYKWDTDKWGEIPADFGRK